MSKTIKKCSECHGAGGHYEPIPDGPCFGELYWEECLICKGEGFKIIKG